MDSDVKTGTQAQSPRCDRDGPAQNSVVLFSTKSYHCLHYMYLPPGYLGTSVPQPSCGVYASAFRKTTTERHIAQAAHDRRSFPLANLPSIQISPTTGKSITRRIRRYCEVGFNLPQLSWQFAISAVPHNCK